MLRSDFFHKSVLYLNLKVSQMLYAVCFISKRKLAAFFSTVVSTHECHLLFQAVFPFLWHAKGKVHPKKEHPVSIYSPHVIVNRKLISVGFWKMQQNATK